jgi:hypothetical protein
MNGLSDYDPSGSARALSWRTDSGAYDGAVDTVSRMTEDQVDDVLAKGALLAADSGPPAEEGARPAVWFLLSGPLTSDAGSSTEQRVKEALTTALGYPLPDAAPELTFNLVIDSRGGSLDTAYRTVLWIRAYAKQLNVYVPRRAKSAATLIALGGDAIYLSPFSELGPLDTQIPDPRNPAKTVSALDCYQSVDYVRRFGFTTMSDVLHKLLADTEGRIALPELVETSSRFALGSITPLLQSVKALDFGGWGRTLRIGQKYAEKLLLLNGRDEVAARDIAERLVYGYTHHPFPIDFEEAHDVGLPVARMDEATYEKTGDVVDACDEKDFVGFVAGPQAEACRPLLLKAHHAGRVAAHADGEAYKGAAAEEGHDE